MISEELKYLIALKEIKGVGDILAKYLISELGSAKAVFNLSSGHLLKIPKLSERVSKEIMNFNDFDWIEKEILWCDKEQIDIIAFNDVRYPKRLKECHDAPLYLFVKGSADLNATKMLSIVGTRSCTEEGKEITEQIIEALAPLGVTIISGLALGIDGVAHKKSLEMNMPTVGVLGHALNQIYPSQHKVLSKSIVEQGALISEFSRRTTFDRNNFPMRNRIVAGMSEATILIESAENGGSMITAEIAHSYGRDVLAVPGKWTDAMSQGPNKLIKLLKAQILTKPTDVSEILGWAVAQQLLFDDFYEKKFKYQNLDEEETKIIAYLGINNAVSIDMIHYSTNIAMGNLSSILLSMEFKGILRALPGKRFQLK
ncbi:MAG TPA: DNA-processing protein DprA [Chitinophagales bacterium]|nr:DNA-processing protein DprA [Chitinophagales bacterium]